mmetsp:Transcript_43805/g.102250  ORF Transcript_43805/g.102250 Transcript_43805/m.102250 type:complete len:90 (-) Transcript_43805:7-276(-)
MGGTRSGVFDFCLRVARRDLDLDAAARRFGDGVRLRELSEERLPLDLDLRFDRLRSAFRALDLLRFRRDRLRDALRPILASFLFETTNA